MEETASEYFGLDDARSLIEQIGQRHFAPGGDNASSYATFFLMQVLGGLFEKAVAYLYPQDYVAAVHFAIALDYYGLLRVSEADADTELLSMSAKGQHQIAFAGDWHGDLRFAQKALKYIEKSGTKLIIHTGDFGAWPDEKDPLSLSLKDFTRDFNVNTTSAFVAAQQAALGFAELPDSASRTFIYTGNITNVAPIIKMMGSGVGKTATAHIIQCAAEAYKDKGFKYYLPSDYLLSRECPTN